MNFMLRNRALITFFLAPLLLVSPELAAGESGADSPVDKSPSSPREIVLWPEGMPVPVVTGDERIEKGADGLSRRFNVSKPRLFVHKPAKDVPQTGAAIIVVPGGGFGRLADEHEGSDVCRWLNSLGIVAFQLAYRTPTNKMAMPYEGPVQDAHQAVLEVRKRAQQFEVDPQKIGMIGFSAGGQTAVIATTNTPRTPAVTEKYAARPDFLLLVYPYQIYDPKTKSLRPELKLDALPPTFLAQMGDDSTSPAQGSALLYFELIHRKIPAELHIYEKGGHGFGARPRNDFAGPKDWTNRAADWLRLHGYATPNPEKRAP